jgi:limonene-1,2-epoxide hydrolase
MSDAESIVNTFIQRICAKDLEGALELVTDDVEYDNVPMRKVFGPAGIRDTLAPFVAGCSAIDWITHHQACTGDVVMNERTDRFEMGGRWIDLAVAGLFIVRDGKICLWRDYFDLPSFQKAMAGG